MQSNTPEASLVWNVPTFPRWAQALDVTESLKDWQPCSVIRQAQATSKCVGDHAYGINQTFKLLSTDVYYFGGVPKHNTVKSTRREHNRKPIPTTRTGIGEVYSNEGSFVTCDVLSRFVLKSLMMPAVYDKT